MTPPFIVGPQFDLEQQIKDQDAAWRRLAEAAGDFLHQAYPAVQWPYIDRLREAIVALATCGSERQLKMLAEQKAYRAKLPLPFQKTSLEAMLIEATEERDKVQHQIEAVEKGLQDMPESIREMMTATAPEPRRDALKTIEARISSIQAQMEFVPGEVDAEFIDPGSEST